MKFKLLPALFHVKVMHPLCEGLVKLANYLHEVTLPKEEEQPLQNLGEMAPNPLIEMMKQAQAMANAVQGNANPVHAMVINSRKPEKWRFLDMEDSHIWQFNPRSGNYEEADKEKDWFAANKGALLAVMEEPKGEGN
jgi:hypothetical protein